MAKRAKAQRCCLTIVSTTCLNPAGDSAGALTRACLVWVIRVHEIWRLEGIAAGCMPFSEHANRLTDGALELPAASCRICFFNLLKLEALRLVARVLSLCLWPQQHLKMSQDENQQMKQYRVGLRL